MDCLQKRFQAGLLLMALVLPGVRAAAAADLVALDADFESGLPAQFSGAGQVVPVQQYAGVGPSGNLFAGSFLRNDTGSPGTGVLQSTVVTLSGLPAHTSVDVRFLLAAIDTWDGDFSVSGAPVPDRFLVKVDGLPVFDQTLCNSNYPNPLQSYVPPPAVQLDVRPYIDRGFQVRSDFGDVAYNFAAEPTLQNIAHSASTLTIEWSAAGGGWQGGLDESWAIDNVKVVLHGAAVLPAAGPLGLLLVAQALLAASLLRILRWRPASTA